MSHVCETWGGQPKRRFATKDEAWAYRRQQRVRIRKAGGEPARGMSVYRCPVCGFWHLGHRRRDTEMPMDS